MCQYDPHKETYSIICNNLYTPTNIAKISIKTNSFDIKFPITLTRACGTNYSHAYESNDAAPMTVDESVCAEPVSLSPEQAASERCQFPPHSSEAELMPWQSACDTNAAA